MEKWLCKDLHNGFCLPLGNRFQKQDNQHQFYSLVLQQLVQELVLKKKETVLFKLVLMSLTIVILLGLQPST